MQRRHSLVGSDSVEPRAAHGRRGEGRCRSCLQERSVAPDAQAVESILAGIWPSARHLLATRQDATADIRLSRTSELSRAPARRSPRRARRATSSRRPPRRACAPAIASRVSRSPQTTTYGIFCSSASRIRLPSVSSRSSASTRTPASRSAPTSSSAASRCGSADRQDAHLHRRQPRRERAGVVLDQDPHESLERAEQRAVDDVRRVLDVVGAHVGEPELLRHLRVELDRPHLPRPAERRRSCGGRSSARRTPPRPRRRSTRCSSPLEGRAERRPP